ncbi:MAG: hypothetical protein ACREDH_09270 [Methylocella sp.]
MAACSVERLAHPWLADAIFPLESHLRRRHAVFECTRDPRRIFRTQVRGPEREFPLSGETRFRPGERLLDLHLWQEQITCLQTSSLGWARQMSERLDISLRELARYLVQHREFEDVAVIRANMSFATAQQSAQLARIAGRYGFEPISDPAPPPMRRRIRRFGENTLISLVVLSRNAIALRRGSLRRGRIQVFLSRNILEHRYGGGPNSRARRERDR